MCPTASQATVRVRAMLATEGAADPPPSVEPGSAEVALELVVPTSVGVEPVVSVMGVGVLPMVTGPVLLTMLRQGGGSVCGGGGGGGGRDKINEAETRTVSTRLHVQ